MRNQQLKELLTRIPPSPETDELQDLLTNMERETMKDTRRLQFMEDHLARPCEIKGGAEDGHVGIAWAVSAHGGTLRETLDVLIGKSNAKAMRGGADA